MGGWGALVIMQLHCESLQNCKIEVKREGFYLSLFLCGGGGGGDISLSHLLVFV